MDPKIERRMRRVKHIVLVLSGKGGVGKSSVAAQLALSLSHATCGDGAAARRLRVGLLDVDLTGPSIPRMLGVDGQAVHQSTDGWVPVYADPSQSLAVMSVGFLLRSRGDSVIWRGPKKQGMIRQFLGDVRWGDLDYLVIDTPPGTSDEHIALMEAIHMYRPIAVLVTTPQAVAVSDNMRSLDFTRKVGLPVVGLVENMSGYVCPHCAECTNVWGKGGGESLAEREGIAFLGRVPIDPALVLMLDAAAGVEEGAGGGGAVEGGMDEGDAETGGDAGAVAGGGAVPTTPPIPPIPAAAPLPTSTIARYRKSQTFPIFQKIVAQLRAHTEDA
ncbi:cytosolic Fe-S cluster assembly factor cfd1 [Malassezia sp. CBS 17886]|nr:cytosolic Fe-S cluster assembly factor cfd1 [Malassezia sp. CBS 17886]